MDNLLIQDNHVDKIVYENFHLLFPFYAYPFTKKISPFVGNMLIRGDMFRLLSYDHLINDPLKYDTDRMMNVCIINNNLKVKVNEDD